MSVGADRRPLVWVMHMKRKRIPKGTNNVLIDLGFEDAEELSTKAILAIKLNKLIESQRLNQAEAAKVLGMPQPKVSAIRNYKLQGISLKRLMQALTALGQHIEIVVTPSHRGAPAGIRVATA